MKDMSKSWRRLIDFEERAAALYLKLARRFVEQQELSAFWLEMSMEERQHALLLEFCCGEQMLTGRLPDRSTLQRVSKLFLDLEKRVRRKSLSVDEAFLIAAELESSELNEIYARVIGPTQGTWYILRKKIATLVPDHVKTLIESAQKFGVSGPAAVKLASIKDGLAESEVTKPQIERIKRIKSGTAR
jgi:hypothetical protein